MNLFLFRNKQNIEDIAPPSAINKIYFTRLILSLALNEQNFNNLTAIHRYFPQMIKIFIKNQAVKQS